MEEVAPYHVEHDSYVLILIVMEDTHGAANIFRNEKSIHVLILIVMEDTHGDYFLII